MVECWKRLERRWQLPSPNFSGGEPGTSERALPHLVRMPQRAENENEDALQSDVALTTLFAVRGKVVVISGGGSGLGAMMATGFVRNGATVYIFSRKDTSQFAAELTATGPGTCTAVVADAQRPATLEALVRRIEAKEGKVHVVVVVVSQNRVTRDTQSTLLYQGARADQQRRHQLQRAVP